MANSGTQPAARSKAVPRPPTPELSARSLRRLVESSARLLAEPDLNSLLPAVLDVAGELVAADGYALWRQLPQHDKWRIIASRGLSQFYVDQMMQSGPGGGMQDSPIVVEDVACAPAILEPRRAIYRAEGIRALLILPLRFAGTPAGTLAFYFRQPKQVPRHVIALAAAFSDLAAGAISAAERRQEQLREKERSDFLAAASQLLGSSLEYEATLAALARAAVPHIADACIIDVLENDGSLRRLVVEHPNSEKAKAAAEVGEHYQGSVQGEHALGRVVRTGKPEFYPQISEADLMQSARDQRHFETLRRMQLRSSAIVPLAAHGRTLGALTLATTMESGRDLNEPDFALAQELALRAAVAIDHARLHRELEQSRQRFEIAQHAAGAWMWEIDLATGRVSRSLPHESMQASPVIGVGGATVDEVVSQIYPDDRERGLLMLKQAAAQPEREHEIEYRMMLPDGSMRWVYLRGRGVREPGKPPRLMGIAMDVTARRQVQEELRAARAEHDRLNALLAAFITSAPVGFALHDPEGRILHVNPALAELNRVPREEHFGKSVHEVIPLIAENVAAQIARVIQTGAAVKAEIEGDPLDPARPRWWSSSYFPVQGPNGEVLAVGAAVTDVTQQKLAEHAARERGRKLEVLTQASRRIHAELQVPSIMRVLLSSAVALVEAEQGAWAVAANGQPYFSETLLSGNDFVTVAAEFDQGQAGKIAARTRKPYVSNRPDDLRRLPAAGGETLSIHNLINVPIVGRGDHLLGCIELYNKAGARPFDFADVELLRGLAASASIAIENARLYAEAQSERARVEAVLANLPLGLILIEAPTGAILTANRLARELSRVSLEPGAPASQYRPNPAFHRDGSRYGDNEYPSVRCLQGEVVSNEELVTSLESGEQVIYRVSAAPVRLPNGQIIAGVLAFDDVTRERKAERELALANERLFRAQEAGRIISWELDAADAGLAWSQNAGDLFGPALPGNLESVTALIHREDRGCIAALRRRLAVEDWANEEFRIVPQAASGARGQQPGAAPPRWVSMRARLYRKPSGEPDRLIGTLIDVTDRKDAEEVMRKAEKLAAMGRLAATVAHEINNPLEAVTNLLYLLKHQPALSAEAAEFLATAERELSRVGHIVKQTLGFYRDTTAPAQVRLGDVADEVLALYSPKLDSRNIEVRRRYGNEPAVRALHGEIRQVLSNLIANCIDAVDRAGGTIEIETGPEELNGRPAARIVIRDNGCGIPPEKAAHLFEPFFTTKRESGTGLGLWVSRGLIEKHGGTIAFESATERSTRGTAFFVTLPTGA
ncbi:MAG: PAS domain-containing protein [Acidobacteria bacterium]|nr:PAS domain-containing protein [Acidobacteriota bacterium]